MPGVSLFVGGFSIENLPLCVDLWRAVKHIAEQFERFSMFSYYDKNKSLVEEV